MYRPGWEDDYGYEEERQEISDREWQEYHSAPWSEWDRVREEVWGMAPRRGGGEEPKIRDSEEPNDPDYPDQCPEHPEPCLATPAAVAPLATPQWLLNMPVGPEFPD